MQNIKNDIFGGVTAAVVALPLALAFGVASGAGASAGLYGAIILGFFASLFGGTPTQISGPTGPMTVVTAAAVLLFKGDISAVMATVLLAGLMQISFGIVKIGRWMKFIPYPVISGFMSGVGFIIIILQINPFLGLEGTNSTIETIISLPSKLGNINFESFIIASMTLVIMLFTPKVVAKLIPPALIALVSMSLVTILFTLNIPTIGEIPTSLPTIMIPSFDILQLKEIITVALTLALLGSIDTLLTSIVADSQTKTKHNSNKELIGQGIGNALCSLFGAIPGAGATMRTVINIKSGAKTNISGMTHAIVLLGIVLFLAPLAAKIPLAVLSGILIKVGLDILDYKFIKVIKAVPRNDLIVMITVFLLTIFVDLIMAVGAGITIASILAIHKISRNTSIQTKKRTSLFNIDLENESMKIIRIDGSLFFGTITMLEQRVNKLIRQNSKYIILDCSKITYVDLSAFFMLEEIIMTIKEKNIKVSMILREQHKRKIQRLDKDNIFKGICINKNIEDAINNIQKQELKSV